LNSVPSAETAVEKRTNVEVYSVSQPIAKPPVSGISIVCTGTVNELLLRIFVLKNWFVCRNKKSKIYKIASLVHRKETRKRKTHRTFFLN
jgi:hypothetical protein